MNQFCDIINRYVLGSKRSQVIDMPIDSDIMNAGYHDDKLCVWAKAGNIVSTEPRRIKIEFNECTDIGFKLINKIPIPRSRHYLYVYEIVDSEKQGDNND